MNESKNKLILNKNIRVKSSLSLSLSLSPPQFLKKLTISIAHSIAHRLHMYVAQCD